MSSSPLPLRAWVEAAEQACRRRDLPALAAAVHRLLPIAPREVQFEIAAVAALADIAEPTACERWAGLVNRLRTATPAPA